MADTLETALESEQRIATTTDLAGPVAHNGKRLTIDISRDLHRILKVRAAEQGLTMAELMRSLISKWVEGERR